jgi:hypothetical protein
VVKFVFLREADGAVNLMAGFGDIAYRFSGPRFGNRNV